MQDRAAQIQKDLEAQRLDGQFKLQKEEARARNELADKQIQAEGQRAAFTESSANNRLERELLFRKDAASQASTEATANRLSDQIFQSGEAAKNRESNATTEQARMQMERDNAARQERFAGEKMAQDAKQFDLTQTAQAKRDETAKSMQQQQIDAQAYEATSRILAAHADKQSAFVDSYMRLSEMSADDLRKTLGQLAADPANPNAAAAQQALARNIADTPSRLEAARLVAVDAAQKSLGDDPAMQFMMRAAPEAVRKQLESVLPKAGEKPKEEVKPKDEKPKERTDLGPLALSSKETVSLDAEGKSKASRGETEMVLAGKPYAVDAPDLPQIDRSVMGVFGNNVNKINAESWKAFTQDKDVNDYVLKAYKNIGTDRSFDSYVAEEWSRKKLIKEAFLLWKRDQPDDY